MVFLLLTYNFRFNTFNSSQSEFLVRQAKSGESSRLRSRPMDTELKYCGTAGKPNNDSAPNLRHSLTHSLTYLLTSPLFHLKILYPFLKQIKELRSHPSNYSGNSIDVHCLIVNVAGLYKSLFINIDFKERQASSCSIKKERFGDRRHHLQGQFTKDQGVDYEDENKR